jgi:hypothetical protein
MSKPIQIIAAGRLLLLSVAGLPIARSISKPNQKQIMAPGRLLLLRGWPPNCQVAGQLLNQTKPNNSCWETVSNVWLAFQLPGQFPTQTKPNNRCRESAATLWLVYYQTKPNQIIAPGRLLLLCACAIARSASKPNQIK